MMRLQRISLKSLSGLRQMLALFRQYLIFDVKSTTTTLNKITMRKTSTLLFMSLLATCPMFAQSGSSQLTGESLVVVKQQVIVPPQMNSAARTSSTATCGNDTIIYPYLKEIVFSAPDDSFFVDAMVGTVRTATQAYHVSSPINVVGVQFWGNAYSTNPNYVQSQPVKVMLYNVDAQNQPTTVIDSAVVNIGTGYDFYEVMFATARTVSANFAVGVKNALNDTVGVVLNNAGASWHPVDYSESLAWRRFGSGTWNSAVSFFGQDMEYMIFPIVNYNVTSSFTASPTTACMGSSFTFTNTSTSLFSNRFLNMFAFDDYWNLASDSTFSWNYGDSPSWSYSMNGSHAYSAPGTYNVMLAGEMLGYYTYCADTMTMAVTVVGPTAGFTVDNSQEPTISFTNTSTGNGTTTYQWNFGDGNTSTSQNPSHTYTNVGTYTVTLSVTDTCGTVTTTQTVTINTVGVNEASGVAVSAFFNPTENLLNITLPASSNATVEVYNVVGKLIYTESGVNTAKKSISMEGLSTGTYVVRVKTAEGFGAAKFAVIK